MTRVRAVAIAGLLAGAALGAACNGSASSSQQEIAALRAELDAAKATIQQMDAAMAANYQWMLRSAAATCQLETKSPNGLDPAKRICPGSPPDLVKPPTYPLP